MARRGREALVQRAVGDPRGDEAGVASTEIELYNWKSRADSIAMIDPLLTVVGFAVGVVVGLTGMGGGALMTPILVLFFAIPPLTAVSSDLVTSAIRDPVGSFVHLRRGTVQLGLVKWLCLGSIP